MSVFQVIWVNLLTPIYRPQLINPNLLTPIYRPQLILPPLICLQGPNYYYLGVIIKNAVWSRAASRFWNRRFSLRNFLINLFLNWRFMMQNHRINIPGIIENSYGWRRTFFVGMIWVLKNKSEKNFFLIS